LFSSFFKGLNCYLWFSSYVQTYLERDIRSITNVRDLSTFRWFLALVASRHGQMLNKTDLAAPLGVSIPTIGEWLNLLELTGQIILVPPYFENLGKRIVKSPKLHLGDSGLAPSARHTIRHRTEAVALFRRHIRGLCGSGDSEKPGQQGR